MDRAQDQFDRSEALLYQRVALLAVVVFPLFGVAYRMALPNDWDPIGPRIAITAGFAAVGLAPAVSPWARRHIPLLLFLAAQPLFHWITTLAVVNGLSAPWILGIVVCHFCGAHVFTRLGYNIAVHASILASIAVALAVAPVERAVPGVLLVATSLTLVTFNVATVLRRRAIVSQLVAQEDALRRARETLEQSVHDRTAELVREVAERRAAQEQAQVASDAKSRFLATMSHELRTPLNAVIGYAELLEDDLADAAPSTRDDLSRISWSAQHLLTMIDNVLDLAKVESGEWEFRSEPVNLPILVRGVVRSLDPLLTAGHNEVIVDVPDEFPTLVGDRTRLGQILTNLIGNAAKFTCDGTVTVRARVHHADDTIRVAVQDTGVGIRSDQLHRIFERFVQVDGSTTRQHDGSGLGLAVSRELAIALGGDISVRSTPGVGSTFELRLPLESSAALVAT